MTEIQMDFTEMIPSTKREGIENVIEWLGKQGVFKAPTSTKFHLNYEGRLLKHSMNVSEYCYINTNKQTAI